MPTIEISLNDLSQLVGRKISAAELEDDIQYAKGELESAIGDAAKVEIEDTNRPDLWSVEGIARDLKGAYRIEAGLPKYDVRDSGLVLNVEKKTERVRPMIVAAVIKGVKLSDSAITQIIQLQEKVAMTYGRKRQQAAIGIYDFDRIKWPVRYTTVKPGAIKFVPLDFTIAMTPKEILKRHPKGQEYGHLIATATEWPILIDDAANVLSMPPVINSASTGKITPTTRNLFIEVTGFNQKIISTALNVMVAALADRGGQIESIRILYGKKRVTAPDMKPKEFAIDGDECRRILGLTISNREIVRLLREIRYDAAESGKKIRVHYSAYRADIMHARDVIEDVAISFGYNDFEPEQPRLVTKGEEDPLEAFSDKIRQLAVGFGLQEVMTFTLTNRDTLFKKMNYPAEDVAEIANPMSLSYVIMKNWLLPSLLELLSKNTHVDYPQKIFEVGDVVWTDEKAETRTRNVRTLAVAIAAHNTSYTDVKAVLDALAGALGAEMTVKELKCSAFIEGRAAEIFVNGKSAGWIGEIHPQVLNNWGLEVPVAVLEIQIKALI